MERCGGAYATAAGVGLGYKVLGGSCDNAALLNNTQQSIQTKKCAPHCASRGAGWCWARSHADQQHQRAIANRSVLAQVGRMGRPLPGGAPSPEPVIDGLTPQPGPWTWRASAQRSVNVALGSVSVSASGRVGASGSGSKIASVSWTASETVGCTRQSVLCPWLHSAPATLAGSVRVCAGVCGG